MSLSYLVLTSCTARKRASASSLSFSSWMLGSDLDETASRWKAALSKHQPLLPANDLYLGRSIVEAKRAASLLDAPLYVVSAGLGVVASEEFVVPYDLTASAAEAGLDTVLERFERTASDWWVAICKGNGIAGLLRKHPRTLFLLALPANYIAMLEQDLEELDLREQARLRIFTSRLGVKKLCAALAPAVMPYDERLESMAGYAGTRTDFCQRALRHFVEILQAHSLDLAGARAAVSAAMNCAEVRELPVRVKVDDDHVKRLIRRQWKAARGRGAVLLRYLRDEALVACEQKRFARLWREVTAEQQGTTI